LPGAEADFSKAAIADGFHLDKDQNSVFFKREIDFTERSYKSLIDKPGSRLLVNSDDRELGTQAAFVTPMKIFRFEIRLIGSPRGTLNGPCLRR